MDVSSRSNYDVFSPRTSSWREARGNWRFSFGVRPEVPTKIESADECQETSVRYKDGKGSPPDLRGRRSEELR